jgi:hypothetical protein
MKLAAPRVRGEVRSTYGTQIAYERAGDGPPVLLIDGALCSRQMGPMEALAAPLAERFTVFRYDRAPRPTCVAFRRVPRSRSKRRIAASQFAS